MPRGNEQSQRSARPTCSDQIKQEIQRFESVHPCIYAVYDLVDLVQDPLLAQQIRDHVVCIEDAFVNSQEWTLSRVVPELKLGVVGSLESGKSALVHRYLTGSYMQEESPEGGRFKKEVVIDGHSYLLLIRDEGGVPEQQFCQWADAVIFVFSVESEQSLTAIYHYYAKMAQYRGGTDIPLILVGTQDAITETTPRTVDENRARKLANDLKRCAYYETCATYGLNVERVFRDACQKVVQQRSCAGRPVGGSIRNQTSSSVASQQTSSNAARFHFPENHSTTIIHHQVGTPGGGPLLTPSQHKRSTSALPLPEMPEKPMSSNQRKSLATASPSRQSQSNVYDRSNATVFAVPLTPKNVRQQSTAQISTSIGVSPAASSNSVTSSAIPNGSVIGHGDLFQGETFDGSSIASHTQIGSSAQQNSDKTLSSTPTAQRKNRRISNIFQRPGQHSKDENKEKDKLKVNGERSVGVGRPIPIKQGMLHKRSSKTLNKEWKKKYVCLYSDGRLTYHPNVKDYMENGNGKTVYLRLSTVKVPGRERPRSTQRALTQPITVPSTALAKENSFSGHHSPPTRRIGTEKTGSGLMSSMSSCEQGKKKNKVLLTAYEFIEEGSSRRDGDSRAAGHRMSDITSAGQLQQLLGSASSGKKRRGVGRRLNVSRQDADDDEAEFVIVSSDERRWQFSAANMEEKEDWVFAIEEQIERALQTELNNSAEQAGVCESWKSKRRQSGRGQGDRAEVEALRQLPGNDRCADCDCARPDWASLNLGTLVCIQCSGIHRNLGSHISRVRSLDLDHWPVEYIAVMQAIGNDFANRLWEYGLSSATKSKPKPDSTREEKEAYIKAKYDQKAFLAPVSGESPLAEQLVEAVVSRDLGSLLLLLPRCSEEEVNTRIGARLRTPLQLACAAGCPELTQLLLWYNANARCLDENGCSALWYAQEARSRDCTDILLNSGLDADYGLYSKTPIDHQQKSSQRTPKDANGKAAAFNSLPASII